MLLARMRAIPSNCKQVNTLGFSLALFYAKDIDENTREFANKCYKEKGYTRYYLHNNIHFPHLLDFEKKPRSSLASSTLRINSELNKMKDIGSPENRNKVKTILRQLENREDFVGELLKSVIYYDSGNSARANRYLRNLLQKPLHINTFLIKNEPNIRSELDSLYKSLFAKLNLLSKNRTLLKAVILKLLINGSPDLIDFLNTEFGFDLDEGEVETWSKSHIYGRPYLGAWVKYYLKENSELSFVNKVGQSSFYEELSKQNPWDAWVLQYELNIPKHNQKRIVDLTNFLKESPQLYFQDMYFALMGSSKMKSLMETKGNHHRKPLFLEKRKFYTSLLEKNMAIPYALFQLVKLGDFNLEYLSYLYE